jgi:hypothetical protein
VAHDAPIDRESSIAVIAPIYAGMRLANTRRMIRSSCIIVALSLTSCGWGGDPDPGLEPDLVRPALALLRDRVPSWRGPSSRPAPATPPPCAARCGTARARRPHRPRCAGRSTTAPCTSTATRAAPSARAATTSVLVQRISTRTRGMPPLATLETDPLAIAIATRWSAGETNCP